MDCATPTNSGLGDPYVRSECRRGTSSLSFILCLAASLTWEGSWGRIRGPGGEPDRLSTFPSFPPHAGQLVQSSQIQLHVALQPAPLSLMPCHLFLGRPQPPASAESPATMGPDHPDGPLPYNPRVNPIYVPAAMLSGATEANTSMFVGPLHASTWVCQDSIYEACLRPRK
jgi:hypothetical protein